MEFPNINKTRNSSNVDEIDISIEELDEDRISNSLTTISLKSSSNIIASDEVSSGSSSLNPKERSTIDFSDATKESWNSWSQKTFGKKELNEIETSQVSTNAITLGLLEEYKGIRKEFRSFIFEVSLDIADATLKLLDVIIFLGIGVFPGVVEEQGEFYYPLLVAFFIDIAIISACSGWRIREVHEMRFVMDHGYSLRWKIGERIVGTNSGTDPRIKRDMKERIKMHKLLSVFHGAISDIPWLLIVTLQGSRYVLNTGGILSIVSGGFSLGMKFANFIDLVKDGLKKKPSLFTVCPAEIRIGTSCSFEEDPETAMESAYKSALLDIGIEKEISLVLVFMTANIDHEKALQKLDNLTGGNVPYSGCTICHGAMMGTQCRQIDEKRLIAIWAISDPEGLYEVGMANLNMATENTPVRKIVRQSVRDIYEKCKKISLIQPYNPSIQGPPSFVWITPPPGSEDEIIFGINEGIGSPNLEIIGGSSADNDVTGQWKQWNSRAGVVSNGLAFVIAHCSAQLKGCAFTGYSATPKVGKVTKMNGPRHILTIDDMPAGEVYDEWTSGHFKKLWDDPKDSNILGPSSVYPLGQVVSQDWDNENVYRSLHPHLLVKKDKSVTVFSDVHEGQEICMMTGTMENIQTKISSVATNIMRSTGIPTSELRGALVVFCAGAMLYVGKDGIDIACRKLDEALGGVNYLGIHTFGEQGPFPDGSVRHGNLMFSALVFSSRRKIMKLSNVDSDEIVFETDPKFKEIALNGGIIGRD